MSREDKKNNRKNVDDYIFRSLNTNAPIFSNDKISIKYGNTDIKLNIGKEIRGGAYGKIYKITSHEYGLEYALKYFPKEKYEDEEFKAIKELEKRELKLGRKCDIITGKIVESKTHKMILMPLMDGDVIDLYASNYVNIHGEQGIMKILSYVKNQLNCILRLNEDKKEFKFAYLDIKPDNILYKLNEDGNYTFELGDLGSIIRNRHGNFTITYRCCTIGCDSSEEISNNNIIRCMRYYYGILCIRLLTRDTYIIDNHKTISIQELETINTRFVNTYGPEFDNYIYDPTPELRTEI